MRGNGRLWFFQFAGANFGVPRGTSTESSESFVGDDVQLAALAALFDFRTSKLHLIYGPLETCLRCCWDNLLSACINKYLLSPVLSHFCRARALSSHYNTFEDRGNQSRFLFSLADLVFLHSYELSLAT